MSASDVKNIPAAAPSAARGIRRFARPVLFFVSLSALALLLFIVIWRLRHPLLSPPEVKLAGIDPAIAEAVQDAQAGVRKSPRSATAWGKLGTVFVVHEFRREGNYCLQQAERLDPREPRWPYIQALDALLANNMETALPKLDRTIALCGNNPDGPRVRLAEVYMSQNRLDEAEKEFRLLLQADPRHARAQLGLARISWQRGDPRSSLEPLGYAQFDLRTRKAACILLAQVHQQLGNTAAAEEAKQRAAILPDDADWPDPYNKEATDLRTGKDAFIKRARQLSAEGKEDQALTLLQDTVKKYPDAAEVRLQLGKTLLKQKNAPYAEASLRRACELQPDNFENVYFLGSALVAQGKMPEATACFRKTTELKPDFAPAWHDLGNCLYHAKDRIGAIGSYRNAVRYDPNLFDNHLNLARLLGEERRYPEALWNVQNALRLNPADAVARKLATNLAATVALSCGGLY
ncbi:MAG TPA: tetratricopeptide repeat protein [Gemmataceae bacterium]|jgi:tetratricopeptide (TPR) repeat protein|nr:tetratricopeptide repeat protein [Gemmataceae bacterium]